jgi:hypothetical protein
MVLADRLAPEPNLCQFVAWIEAQWKSDDAAPGMDVTTAFWQTSGEYARQMPYCAEDGDAVHTMPLADDLEPTPRKKEPRRIWNPFPPKGTEVGGREEIELSPNGNDCREDPAKSMQLPGCLNPTCRESKKVPSTDGEEPSELPEIKSRNIEQSKPKKGFDESKLQPFAAPIKLDTMEFRPSDWGRRDVALPPF